MVNMAEQHVPAVPNFQINNVIPEQSAPVVNVDASSTIANNLPATPPAVVNVPVNVTTPKQEAPVVNFGEGAIKVDALVNIEKDGSKLITIRRSPDGKIKGAEVKDK